MTLSTTQRDVISAEKNVTSMLSKHGEESLEYKIALKDFASSWLKLTNREDSLNAMLEN